jgi:hypothetical protein
MDNTAKVVAWAGGAIFVGAYIVLLILQFGHIDAGDAAWNRRLELLNPLQALAFAGAGVLLGTAVQQQATKKAQDLAEENQEDANKGRALEAVVKAKAAAPEPTPPAIQELLNVAEEAGS